MTSEKRATVPDPDALERWSVARLRDLARERGVRGRSRMSKAELVDALGDGDHPAGSRLAAQGTASLGLPRYYLMVEGPRADGSDDVVLELKQARRSALDGLAPPGPWQVDGYADRITHAHFRADHALGAFTTVDFVYR